MATTLEQVIGYRNLTGVIQDKKGGVPSDILPPGFFTPTRRITGHTCSYQRYEGTRKTARRVDYGSPSVRRDLKKIADVPVVLMHSFENQQLPMDTLTQLSSADGQLQDLGKQEVARQTAAFRSLFDNLRTSSVWSIFKQGIIYFNGDGELLPSASGAVVTMDFSVPANNKNQCNSIIATKWDTTSANIPKQIAELKEAARKLSGYPLRHAFYGSSIPGYLGKNTLLANLIGGNPALAQGFLQPGVIPNPFLGLTWHPANEAFYEDKDGTNQDWIAHDVVVFTPEPDPGWWEVIEGSFPVPRTLRIGADASAAASDFVNVNGRFSYAAIGIDAPGIKQFGGDTFLPTLKVPGAIFIADVDF